MAKSREKFKDLAEKRVSKTIKDLRLVANLANRNNYIFEQDDADKIVTALESELRELKSKFKNSDREPEKVFKL